MKNIIQAAIAALGVCGAIGAQASVIGDVGSNAYWGGDAHGYGDVIGESMYDILGAGISRSGNQLTIQIDTNFAGHAGADAWAAPKGIAYSDLFLAPSWTPFGVDAHHLNDNASNGTHWTYGLSLDNRWNNSGGTFKLYELGGSSNIGNVLFSNDFLSCALGSQCYYRNGQAVAVNTGSANVHDTGLSGTWTVSPGSKLLFTLDVGSSVLGQYTDLALHWGETCQNDVIEGTVHVPEPLTPALFFMGLAGLAMVRRRTR